MDHFSNVTWLSTKKRWAWPDENHPPPGGGVTFQMVETIGRTRVFARGLGGFLGVAIKFEYIFVYMYGLLR